MILVRSQLEVALIQSGPYQNSLTDASYLKGDGKIRLLNVFVAEKVKSRSKSDFGYECNGPF